MSFYKRNRNGLQLIIFFSIVKLILHLISNSNYGFHRDELLYMAMADHLDWGYKEVPPVIAGATWFTYTFIGDSVFAMRLLPSIAGACIVFLTGLMVMALTGRRFAIVVACSAIIISPSFLASGYLMQPVVFDQLFWALSAFLIIKHIQSRRAIYIYLLGVCVGLGMLTKYTMAFFVISLVAGLLISPQRKIVFTKPWLIAAITAFVIVLPNLLWQINHDLPVITHMNELKAKQLNYVNPIDFIIQTFITHASSTVVWLSGFIYLFFTKSNKRYRFIAFSFIIVIGILLALKGKVYYSFGAYPMLFAAGGVCLQKVLGSIVAPLRYASVALILAPSLILVPIVIPVLPFRSTLHFFEFTTDSGLKFPVKWEDQELHATTQDYADMLGWEEMARLTKLAYDKIPAAERAQSTIIAGNYGQAGAIKHFKKKYKLPEPVSLSSSFALWSPDSIETKHVIFIDEDVSKIAPAFSSAIHVGTVENPYAREKGTSVYLFSDPVTDVNRFYKSVRMDELD